MKFQPGQNRIRRGGTTFIKDVVQTQVDPPKEEITQPKEEITQPKEEIKPMIANRYVLNFILENDL